MAKIARFYGYSPAEQLTMLLPHWLLLLHWLVPLLGEERASVAATVTAPLVQAVFVAPQEKRREGIRQVLRVLQRLLKVTYGRDRKRWTGQLSKVASRRLDAQIARLAAQPDLAPRIKLIREGENA